MAVSFFFYDLETSGFSPFSARIMQFAGQRTDADLQPIGDPVNLMIRLAPDVLPDPGAIMITGITPQSTQLEGLTEVEFLRYFYDEIVTADTTFLGFNTVRFDDEFMRALHYRNFYDPYRWQWADGCSRWDMLDVVRMTRALRPDGITWPHTKEGKPTNRLEALTAANGLDHEHAHDALSDVTATIAVAQLLKKAQPDMFNYLFNLRSKKSVSDLVSQGQPFIYTSGRYPSETLHTTVAIQLASHTNQDSAIVYDVRYDPTPFLAMSPEALVQAWRYDPDRSADEPRLPVKSMKFNRCPAIAPMGVIKASPVQQRLNVDLALIERNAQLLRAGQASFAQNIAKAVTLMDERRQAEHPKLPVSLDTVDGMMYDSFIDKNAAELIRRAEPQNITDVADNSADQRVKPLATLYKARNFPASLSEDERAAWDEHIKRTLFDGATDSRLARYFSELQRLSSDETYGDKAFLLEELRLYGESLMPGE